MAKQLNVDMRFTADTSKAKQSIQELQNAIQKLGYGTAPKNGLVNPAEFEKASSAARELAYHLNNAYNAKTGNLDLSRLNSSLKAANTDLPKLTSSFKNAGATGQQAFVSLAKAIASADQPALTLNSHLSTMWTTLKNVARFQLSSSIMHGLIGGIQSAYGYAQDLNESLNNIRIVTGQSVDQMARFAEEANKAARNLSSTTLDYTNASLIYYQQGLDDAAVKERTDVTIKMANVARESAETVSEQMTAIWNNFDDGSKSLEYYADVITALGAATASSSSEISQGLEKFAAVADTVGLSYENATAALATITATTRQSADTVGTGLRTLFSRLQGLSLGETLEDGVDLNKYSKALETVGVQALDSAGNLRRMDEVLEDLGERWGQLSNAQQTALAQTVGGVRQYTTLIALMDNWDFMKQNQEVAANAEGTLQGQADIYAESWEAAQKRVQAAAQAIYSDLINDKFFIKITNLFETVLTGLDTFIDHFGGLKSLLIAALSFVLSMTANKIGPALQKMVQNIQVLTGGAKNVYSELQGKFQKNVQNEIDTGNYNNAQAAELTGTSNLLLMRTKLNAVTEELSETEKMQAELAIQGLQLQTEAYKKLGEEVDQLIQSEQQASKEAEEAGRRQDQAMSKLTEANHNAKVAQSGDGSGGLLIQSASSIKKSIGFESIVEESKKAGNAIADNLCKGLLSGTKETQRFGDAFNNVLSKIKSASDLKEAKAQLNDFRNLTKELFKDISSKDKQEIGALFKQAEQTEDIQVFSNILDSLIQKLNTAGIKSEDLGKVLINTFGMSETAVNNLIQARKEYDEAVKANEAAEGKDAEIKVKLEAATKKYTAAQEQANESAKNFKPQHVVDGIQTIVSLAAGLAQVVTLFNVVKSIWETLNDEDATFGEKAIAILSALSTALFAAIGLMRNFKSVKDGIFAGAAKRIAASTGEAAATAAEGAAAGAATPSTMAFGAALWTVLAPILPLVGAFAVLGIAIADIIATFKAAEEAKPENVYKRITAAANDLNQTLATVSTSMDELTSKWTELNNGLETLHNLVQGTSEWNDQLLEVNAQVLELINQFPILSQYLTFTNGVLGIDPAGYEQFIEDSRNAQLKIQSSQLFLSAAANNVKTQIAPDLMEDPRFKEFFNTITKYGYTDNDALAWLESGVNSILNETRSLTTAFATFGEKKNGTDGKSVTQYAFDKLDPSTQQALIAEVQGTIAANNATQQSAAVSAFNALNQGQITALDQNQYYNGEAMSFLAGFNANSAFTEYDNLIKQFNNLKPEALIDKYITTLGLENLGYRREGDKLFQGNQEVTINLDTLPSQIASAMMQANYDNPTFAQDAELLTTMRNALLSAAEADKMPLSQDQINEIITYFVKNAPKDGQPSPQGLEFSTTSLAPEAEKTSLVNAEELKNYGLEEASIRQQMANIQEQYNVENKLTQESIDLIKEKKQATDATTKEILKQLDADGKLVKAEKISEEAAYNLAVQNQRMNKGVETLSNNWEDWSNILKKADRTGKDYADTVVAITDTIKELVGAEGDFVLPDGWLDAPGNMELLGKAAEGDIDAINELGFSIAGATVSLLEYNEKFNEILNNPDNKNKTFDIVPEVDFTNAKNQVLAGIETLQEAVKNGTIGIGDDISTIGDALGENWINSLNTMARATGMAVPEMNSILNELGVKTTVVEEEVTLPRRSPIQQTVTTVDEWTTYNGSSYPTKMTTQTHTIGYEDAEETVMVAQIGTGDNATPPTIEYVGNGPVSSSSVTNNTGNGGGGSSSNKSSTPKSVSARYHDTLNRREKTKNTFDKAQNEKEELWGQARIDKWKEAQKALEDYIKAQQDLLKDTERWLKTDKKALQDALSKIDITITPQFDENGTITNYEAILEQIDNLYQKYNGNEDMTALIEAAQKALEQYDKTSDLWIGRKKELDELNKQLNKLRKEEQIEQKERERYHRIERELAENDRKLEEERRERERAYGEERLTYLREEQQLLQERQKLYEQYLAEIEKDRKYIDQDRNDLIEAFTTLGLNVEFDENGEIANIEELFDKVDEAWHSGDNSMFGTDLEEAKKRWDKLPETIKRYEDTLDLLHEKEQKLAEVTDELLDNILELVTTQVELRIEISDRDLKRIEYALKHIEDDVYKTAEALALLGRQGDVAMNKIAAYEQGIADILNISLEEFQTLSDSDLQTLLSNLDANAITQVEEYCDALREQKIELMELQKTIVDKVLSAYDELNEKVDEAYDRFSQFSDLLSSYNEIVELSAGVFGPLTDQIQDFIRATNISNAQNQTTAARERLAAAQADLAAYSGDNEEILKRLQEAVRSANEAFLSSIQETLQALQEAYDDAFNDIFDNLDKWVDNAEKVYGRQKELNEEYLTDYEKTYQLNKLSRDLDKTLNNTNSTKGRARLLELQKEINDGMADANRLSAYDVEFLQKKLALEQARLDLENARNAKSYMQLQRGADGQWGYVYTADEAAVEQAEQAYEDRQHDIYELQKRQEENLTTQLHDLASSWSQAKRELDERRASGELTEEQYQAEYAKQEAFYKERARYMFEQMGNLFDNNNWADQMYNMGLAMGIDESTLKNILESDNLEDAMNLFLDHFSDAQTASDEAYATYQNRVSAFFAENGVTAKTLQDAIEQIGTGSKENIDEVTKASLELSNEFRKDVVAANAELAKLDASIKSVTDKLDPLIERLYNLMNVLEGGTPMDLSGVDLTKNKTIIDKTPPIGILPTPISPPVPNTTSNNTGVPFSANEIQSFYQSALAALNNNYFTQIGSDFLRLLMPQIPRIISDALDQTVQITASFPSVVDHNEIEEAFNNLINKATQYANRKTMWSQTFGDNYNY